MFCSLTLFSNIFARIRIQEYFTQLTSIINGLLFHFNIGATLSDFFIFSALLAMWPDPVAIRFNYGGCGRNCIRDSATFVAAISMCFGFEMREERPSQNFEVRQHYHRFTVIG